MHPLLRLLRTMCEPMPPGSSLTLPCDWLRAQLEATGEAGTTAEDPLEDLTIEQAAELAGRAPSTVRSWARHIPGATRRRGREWRIPRAALAEFLRQQEEEAAPQRGKGPDLGEWRRHLPPAA